jgi:nucleotide-binding universal stress UspA family protein
VSYRTILTHLNDSRRARRLLDFAAELARAFEARVIGLHVSARLRLQAMASPLRHIDVLSSLKFTLEEEADHLRSIFEDAASRQRFTGEFRCLTAERVNPSGIVLARAHAADLIVASQTDPQWALSPLLDCSDDLAIGSGRPVIIVPNDRECVALPNKVIIAWNQSRESTRAIFDALPLLKGARAVELLTFDEVDKEGRADLQLDQEVLPASAVADVLMGHGIKSTIATVKAPGVKVGDEICARATGERANLIVMGAYGHTRLRELVFGGTTRHVLKHMPVPVLFSH